MITDRNYFGSEHGKSASDGETGVVNRAVDRAIVGRQVIISNFTDMVNWCNDNLCASNAEFTRRFFLVEVINHDRPETDVRTITGVRKFHQVRSTGTEYHIMVRNLSCFCEGCQKDNGMCLNESYISKFKPVTISRSSLSSDSNGGE